MQLGLNYTTQHSGGALQEYHITAIPRYYDRIYRNHKLMLSNFERHFHHFQEMALHVVVARDNSSTYILSFLPKTCFFNFMSKLIKYYLNWLYEVEDIFIPNVSCNFCMCRYLRWFFMIILNLIPMMLMIVNLRDQQLGKRWVRPLASSASGEFGLL